MPPPQPRFLLPLALTIAILAVSTASIFIRFAQAEAPSLTIAAFRLTIASLALAPIALFQHRAELQNLGKRDLIMTLFSGLFLAVHFAAWISSLEYTTVASSVVLVSTSPLWAALMTPIFLHEKLGRGILAGMLLALLGGILIAASDSCGTGAGLLSLSCPPLSDFLYRKAMWGNFLALVGAWAVTGYLLIGRRLRSGLSLIPYIFVVYSMAAIALILIMLVSGQSITGFHPSTYLWMILLALIPQLIGHSTYNWALRYIPAALVAVTILGEPVGSTILAYLVLNETPGTLTLAGGLLILLGIFLASRSKPSPNA
ncbi:MAG: DMT family transporter [Anaerolineales bacterium]|nr:DMT family transporter [Anaerolineales bacterium]